MKNILLFTLIFLSLSAHAQIITTVAGNGITGYNGNIHATAAELYDPHSVAVDGKGNFYIADTYNNRIRKVDRTGIITTIAGNDTPGYNGNGIPAITAELYSPVGIICDHYGNIYFADAYNNRVRKIDTAGIITTVAGNGDTTYNGDNIQADSATIYDPHAVAIDAQGNMYITEFETPRIRKVNTSGVITTIAGTGVAGYTGDNGVAINAEVDGPFGIVVDDTGNIYFSDAYKNVVRKIDTSGIITTFAGTGISSWSLGDNGPADSASLDNPAGLAIDVNNNIYIADAYHSRIRKVTAATNIITTVAGSGIGGGFGGDYGSATTAKLDAPFGVVADASGDLYIADAENSRIRLVGWPLGITQLSAPTPNTIIYPNPVVTTLNVQSVFPISQISITNIYGQIVCAQLSISNIQAVKIDVAELPSGVYFVKINENETKKFVKE